MSKLAAWFGGTFDPIHLGHLNCARELAEIVGLDKVTLLPNNVPPHRAQPIASAEQRVTMLTLATQHDPLFTVDPRELARTTPSWTIETLELLRSELGPTTPLAFIIGQDSFLSLNRWHRWSEILDYCHLLVAQRPGYASHHPEPKVRAWLNRHTTAEVEQLHHQPAGSIYLADTAFYSISATDIRRRLQQGLSCQDLLMPEVSDYISQTGLYRR